MESIYWQVINNIEQRSGAIRKLKMPRKIAGRQYSSQESLASIRQYEGHSNQECTRDDAPKIAAEKRKKICKDCIKKRSLFKSKRNKIEKGSYNNGEIRPSEYVFYSVLNTNYNMDQGTAAAAIARSLIALHRKLDSNNIMGYYIDRWSQTGENIVILEGFDNKHLKYLHDEVKYVALDTHVLHRRWSSGRDILVLTVFGQQDDLEDFFEGLIPLR